jgi:hypothetical protein
MTISVVSWKMLPQHLIAAGVVLVLLVLAAWGRVEPFEVWTSDAVTPQVKRMGTLVVQRRLRWVRGVCSEMKLSAQLIDSLGNPHALAVEEFGAGSDSTSREIRIPLAMPYGKARYEATATVSCFPFYWAWPVAVQLPSIPFEVIP